MKQIIVVDDDFGIQEMLHMVLSRAGYAVTVFSGAEPIYNGEFEVPHLFLLDKQLSGADGLDVCEFLKAQENTKHTPIIMISANLNIGTLAQAAGADDFIEKPFQIKELLGTIAKYIGVAEKAAKL